MLAPAVPRPSLSIWRPDSENASASEPLTLVLAFKKYRLPEMGDRSHDTIAEYETHLRRWEEFWREVAAGWESKTGLDLQRRINSPALSEVGKTELLAFREWLVGLGTLSARTVNKHLGSLQAIAESCITEGLIGAFPRIPRLPENKRGRKLHLAYEEATALKAACLVAEWPRDLPFAASLYWEALVVGFCVYGFRTQEQVAYEKGSTPLQWADIRLAEETPHPDGKAVNRHGWLVYTPQKQKRRKPEPLVLPIIGSYRHHLDAIRPPEATGPVFPFPLHSVEFYRQWAAIRAEAEIAPKPGLDGSQPDYDIRHLRKTATRWINDHGASIGMPGIGDQITGHADDRSPDREVQSRVTRDHYDFAEDRILRALTTLPLPDSFAEPLTGRRARQLKLF